LLNLKLVSLPTRLSKGTKMWFYQASQFIAILSKTMRDKNRGMVHIDFSLNLEQKSNNFNVFDALTKYKFHNQQNVTLTRGYRVNCEPISHER